MNKIFKVIWDVASQQFVVTSELGKAKGKTKSIKTAKTALATVVAVTGGVYSTQALAVQAATSNVNSVAYSNTEGLSVSYGIATGNSQAVAIGGDSSRPARAAAAGAIAIGGQANATGATSTAVGWNSTASGENSVAYGASTVSSATGTVAIGLSANASANAGIAIGELSKTIGTNSVAIGLKSNVIGHSGVAVGNNATAAQDATAYGVLSNATALYATAIGPVANALAGNAIAVGYRANASSASATAMGDRAKASAENAVAVGVNSNASVADAVALGSGSVANRVSGMVGYDPATKVASTATNSTWSANAAAVSIGNGTATTRQLTSLAAGTNDTDAVNVAQLKALAEVVASNTIRYFSVNSTVTGNRDNTGATATNAIAIGPDARGQLESSVALGHNVTAIMTASGGLSSAGGGGVAIGKDSSTYVGGVSVGTNATSGMIPHAVSIGYNTIINTAPYIDPDNTQQKIGGIAIGDNVVSKSQSVAIGVNATAVGKYNVVMGTDTIANGERDIVIGNGAVSQRQNADSYNIVIGRAANATENAAASVAIGLDAVVNNSAATAVGRGAQANGLNSAAFGYKAAANGSGSVAQGELSNATGENSVAVGSRAEATATGSIAMGLQSDSLKNHSIGIGTISVANATYGVAIGAQTRVYDTAEAGVALGFATYTRGMDGIGIGRESRANGTSSIVIGSHSKVEGTESIAIGKGHVVEANNAGTFGDPNYILAGADRSYVIGNNNTVNTADTFVLGSNVNRLADGSNNTVGTVANSVYLGNGTEATAGTAVGTAVLDTNQVAGTTTTAGDKGTVTNATVANVTYGTFAGATANGVVSVGAAGAERRVQNVAAGEISATSTDAINGSQLYAVAKQAAAPLTFTANTNTDTDAELLDKQYAAADGTQQQLGEKIAIIGAATGTALTRNTDAVVSGDYSAKNIQTVVSNGEVQIQMAENPIFDSVQFGDTTGPKITNDGTDIKVGSSTDAPVKITNVANGTNPNDAVNLSQLNATKVAVLAGDNTAVTSAINATTGGTDYTVHADKTEVAPATGSNITVTPTTTTNANGTETTTYSLDLDQATKAQIAKEETVSSGTPNLVTVAANATKNATGGNDFVVSVTQATYGTDVTTDSGTIKAPTTDGVITGNQLTNIINEGFWTAQVGGEDLKEVNFGDELNFVNGNGTKAVAKDGGVAYDVNLVSTDNTITFAPGADGAVDIKVNTSSLPKTVVEAGTGPVAVTGTGTAADPYKVSVNTTTVTPSPDQNLNGSVASVTDPSAVMTAGDVITTIKNAGFKLTASANGGAETGSTVDSEVINPGDTVDMAAGKNLVVKQEANGKITYATADDVTFNNVTTSNLTATGNTTVSNFTVTPNSVVNMGGNTITNVANGTNATDAVNLQQLNATKVTVREGKNTNVTSTVNATTGGTDYTVNAVDTSASASLDAASAKYLTVAANGTTEVGNATVTDYKVGLSTEAINKLDNAIINVEDTATVNMTVTDGTLKADVITNNGSGTTVNTTAGGVSFDIKTDGTTVNVGTDGNLTVVTGGTEVATNGTAAISTGSNATDVATIGDLVDTINSVGWFTNSTNVGGNTTGTAADTKITAGKAVNFEAGTNLKVEQKVVDGNVTYTYATSDNVTFNNVTTNNFTVNQGGTVNMGGNTVTNVANGTNATDAVNLDQLNASTAANQWKITGNNDATTATTVGNQTVSFNNGTGTTAVVNGTNVTYNINTDGTTVKVGTDGNLTVVTGGLTNNADGNVTVPAGETGSSLVNQTTVADAINNSGWKLAADGTAGTELINPSDTVTFIAGTNLEVVRDGANITYKTADNVTFNNITASNLTLGPVTITNDGIYAGNTTITNVAPGTNGTDAVNLDQLNASTAANQWKITGNNNAVNATTVGNQTVSFNNGTGTTAVVDGTNVTYNIDTDGTTVKVGTDGNLTVVTGNLTNNPNGTVSVPTGEAGSSLVNQTTVSNAINNSGWQTTLTDGTLDTINPGDKVNYVNGTTTTANVVKDGSGAVNVSYEVNTTAISQPITANTDGKAELTPVNGVTDANKLVTSGDVVNTINQSGWKLAADGTAGTELINPSDTVTFIAGNNLEVVREGANITYKTAENVSFNNVTANNVTVGPVTITNGGINAGNTTITNVAPGTNGTDAVNLDQLNASTASNQWKITGNNNAVNATTVGNQTVSFNNGTGTTAVVDGTNVTYNIDTDGTTVKVGTDGNLTVVTGNLTNNPNGTVSVPTGEAGSSLVNQTTVSNVINNSGWQTTLTDGTVDTINPGDKVNYVNGTTTTANVVKDGSGAVNVSYEVNTTAISQPITANTDGKAELTPVDGKTDANKLVTAGDVINTINQSGWKLAADGTAGTELINPSETVTFIAGTNLKVVRDGANITYKMADDVTFNNVTTNNFTVNPGGTVNMGGNTVTNVAPGTNGTDAVNLDQLNASTAASQWKITGNNDAAAATTVGNQTVSFNNGTGTTAVVNGTNVTYNINTDGTTVKVGTDGNLTVVTGGLTTNTDGNVTVPAGETGSSLVNQTTVANAINNSGWKLAADGTAGTELINPSETVTFKAGTNLEVVRDGANITYKMADDVTFNNVTASNLTVGPVTITNDGIDAGNTTITNVAPGTNGTDAVNLDQLNSSVAAAKTEVTSQDKTVTVNTTTGAAGQTIYDLSVKTDGTTIKSNTTTGALEVVTGNTTVNSNGTIGIASGSNATDIATIGDITNTINQGYWTTKVNGTEVDQVNFGDAVNYVNGNGTVARADGANITFDVKTDGNSIIVDSNGSLAVNTSNLPKTALENGTNTVVTGTGSEADPYKVNVEGDLTNITSIANGDTKITLGDQTVDVGGSTISNVKAGEKDDDAVNVSQLNETNQGWTITTSGNTETEGVSSQVKLGKSAKPAEKTVTISGGKNIKVKQEGNTVSVATTDTPTFETVTVGGDNGVTMSSTTATDGVKEFSVGTVEAPTRITNVAPGVKDTDAVNVSQLKQVQGNVNAVNKKVDKLDKRVRGIGASSAAASSLPQVYIPGKSMVAAAAGGYGGASAVAVGYSRASDNGKLILKLQGTANSQGHVSGGVGVGYQW